MSDEQQNGWTDPGRTGRTTAVNGSGASTVPGPRGRGDRATEVVSPNVTEHLTEPVPLMATGPVPDVLPDDLPGTATGPVPGPVPGPAATRTAAPTTSGPRDTSGAGTPTAERAGRTVRPRVPRSQRTGRVGPWAPVAGAGAGVLAGIVVALLLRSSATAFDERLALVFVVLALALLGAGGTLLTEETRLMRRGVQAAESRAAGAGVIAGLLNGLTPARLLVLAGGFVLLLSAYVTQRG